MSRILISAFLLVAFLSVADARPEADDPAVRQLVEQGRYWQSRSRWEEAAQTWNKLLLSHPQHPEGLSGLAFYELQAGRTDAARAYLDRLRELQPAHPAISQLAKAVESTAGTELNPLDKARQLAAEQRYAEAIEQYAISFGGLRPQGELALEYYQTLGATDAGWEAARRGLAELLADHPNEPRYALALAQHLTYRESHRREGIAQLQALAERPEVATPSRQAWRQALLWLRFQSGDDVLYEAYLQHHRDDDAVRARLAELRRTRTPEQNEMAKQGYEALEKEDLTAAKRSFERLLKGRSNDAEALAGLGIAHFRGGDYHQARDLLGRALKAAPERRKAWAKAYDQALFWALVRDAERARDSADLGRAEQLMRQALKISPQDPDLRVTLAEVMAERGRYQEAEIDYRRVLKQHPAHARALQGLVSVLSHQERTAEALALIEGLSGAHQQTVRELRDRLLATSHRARAESFANRGDAHSAQHALEQALVLDPDNPWVRLDLARLYQRQGAYDQARSLMQGLLLTAPANSEALYASALLSAEAGDAEASLGQLSRIPAKSRTPAMRALEERLRAGETIANALALARRQQRSRAYELLSQVERDAGTNADVVAMLANAWVELGEEARGLGLLRQAMGHQPKPALRIQYAGVLLRTGQDSELTAILRELKDDPRLTHQERRDLENLVVGHAVRHADIARQKGDLAGAYDLLAPYVRQAPPHATVLLMLGHLYRDAGEPRAALDLYLKVLQHQPGEMDARGAAFGAAMKLGEVKQAEALVTNGLEQYPDNPEANALAGRLAHSRGREAQAIKYFERALMLLGAPEEVSSSESVSGQGAAGGNPFTGTPVRMTGGNTVAYVDREAPRQRVVNELTRPVWNAYDAPVSASDFAALERTTVPVDGVTSAVDPVTVQQASSNPFRKAPLETYSTRSVAAQPRADEIRESHQLLHDQLRSELQAIRAARGAEVATGLSIRARDGEEGLGELHDLEIPLQAELSPKGDSGRLTLRIVPVNLSAGDLNLNDVNKARRFGSNALAVGFLGTGSVSQDEQGIGIGAKWEYRDWAVDVGSSGLGFAVDNVTGGVRWQPALQRFRFGFGAFRRPVTDSLLSYAGTQDTFTGVTWGGVVSTGGQFDIAYDEGQYGLYGTAAYAALDGERVASNKKIRLGGGLFWRAYEDANQRVTAGVDVNYFGYDKNLSHFTLGQGGYFSPHHYTSFGVPVTWSGRHDKVSFGLTGYLGLQTFKEDASPFFPDDPDLQSRLETLAQSTPDLEAFFPGQSKTGVSYNFSANVAFQIQPKLAVGGNVSFDNARDYNEQTGMVYVRYFFQPQHQPVAFPPKPVRPLYSGTP
ncbi:MAG: cellulose synthase subunit BcsC-related outer membrane protein [Gammaproteobacteria bacterium]